MKELLLEVFSGFKFLQEICVQSWGSLGFQPDFHLEAVRTLPSVCPLLRTVLSFPSYVWNHEYPENLRTGSLFTIHKAHDGSITVDRLAIDEEYGFEEWDCRSR